MYQLIINSTSVGYFFSADNALAYWLDSDYAWGEFEPMLVDENGNKLYLSDNNEWVSKEEADASFAG